jgi:uncharacterized repeat protein (TIGR01451 family)
MSKIDRFKLRTFLASLSVTIMVIAVLGTATAFAICVPTVYSVTSSAPPPIGNWTDPSGAVWSPPGGFPGCAPGDVAQDLNASPTTLIINSAIPNPIIGLNLNCPGCAIDIQSGGSLILAGPGAVSGSSTIIVEPGGTLTIANGGTLTFNSGTSLSVNGGHVDLQSGGTLNLNGASTSTNNGVLDVNGGTLHLGALFTVQSSGTLQFTAGSVTGSNTISNNGTVQMVGGGVVNVSPILNNNSSGTVTVSSGTLSLGGGGTGNGPFNIAGGAVLDFPSSTYTMTTNGVVSGDGTLSVSGGTLTIGGVTSPGTFSLSAGQLDGPGFLSIRNFLFWDGGTITGSGGAELAGTGSGTASGNIGPMTLDTRTFNIYGTLNYDATTNMLHLNNNAALNTYGTFSFLGDGDILADGPSSVGIFPNGLMQKHNGTGVSVIQPTATNNATVFVTSGAIEFAGGGTHTGSFFPDSNGSTLGSIIFSASATINGSVSGAGNVSFTAGNTDYNGFFYSIGGKTSITGATLTVDRSISTTDFQFGSGEIDLNDDFDMAGTGTWSGGTMSGEFGDGTFYVDLGATLTIDSANSVTMIDVAALENDGTLLYTPNQIVGSAVRRRARPRTVTTGYLALSNGAAIFNEGTFDLQTDTQIAATAFIIGDSLKRATALGRHAVRQTSRGRIANHGARAASLHPVALCGCPNEIDNDGTLVKSAGSSTGSMDFGPAFFNYGTLEPQAGTLHFLDTAEQDDGTTTLGPGNISADTDFNLNVGTLTGAGTITGDVYNSGEIKPGNPSTTGVINITGNYTMGSTSTTGTLTIKIAGPSAGQFDQLNVTGTTALDGTFNASFIGGYTPATGTTVWPVLTYASELGTFATQNLPTYTGGAVTSAYDPAAFDLTAVTPPAADLNMAMNGPAAVNAGAPLSYTIDINNLGTASTSGTITVIDTLPSGATGVSGSGTGWSCGAPTTTITCTTPGPLASGNALPTLTIAMTAPAASGNVTNSATVSNSVADPNATNNTASVTTNVGPQANLSITKTGPASVSAGQNIVYTIVVNNAGPSAATATVVSDPTPVGVAFLSNTGGCTTAYPCSLGPLNPGQTVTITSTYNVPNSYASPSVSNTATVSSSVNDPNLADNSSTATTSVTAGVGNADVSVTKTGPPSVVAGSNITYTITINNAGPASATNTFVNDSTPAGLTFVSNSGACSGPFPCALGTLTSGQTVVITSTFNVPAGYAGGSISNTATVSTSSPETITTNNTSTAITPVSVATGSADLIVTKSGRSQANLNEFIDFTVVVQNNGPGSATNVVVSDPTPPGLAFAGNSGACTTAYPCLLGTLNIGQTVVITSHYRVTASSGSITNTASVSSSAADPVASNNSSSATVNVVPTLSCPGPTVLTAPASGAIVSSPVTLTWATVQNATSYLVTVTGSSSSQTFPATTGSLTLTLADGPYSWSVQSIGSTGCPATSTAFSTFTVCSSPGTPIPSVVGLTSTGQTYTVQWTPIDGTSSYELQESSDPTFTSPTTTTLAATSQPFTKNVQTATTFYYRVRAIGGCTQSAGPFSATAPVIIIPLPPLGSINPNIPVPSGSKQPVTFPIHVNGLPGISTSFIATVDKPWLAVTPSSGVMPPEGVTFTISADPSTLQDGTWTGTIVIVFGTSGVSGKLQPLDAAPKTSIPVSISLTTPVTPGTLTSPASTAVVIPSVGHLAGLGSQWQSDIRVANITALSKKVQLTFSGGSATSQAVRSTTLSIDPGATTALDDLVRNWYGVGAMGDSSNGVLTVQPLDATGKPDLSIAKSTVVSSRTYNASAVGTLGQFIPGVPLANFISKAPGAVSILALQQIAQTDTFRTNLGLVEATGKAANVLVSVFNAGGSRILDLPVSLAGGEQKQLNSFLADKGITLTNGHIEVQAVSGDGKVTAYASVIDSRSTDPLLVSGVPIGGTGASRFVIPGVASLDTGASWRSDIRVFNGSLLPQTTTLTLYPTGNPTASVSHDVTIQPGEVKALDDIVHSTFNLTNAGGALHVTTAVAVPLIVTARTYDDTPGGTLGQFVQAVTPADAVGNGDRSLQLLQMEDSPRYRTNLGLAEVTGKPVTAEVTVILPDSKVAPKVQITLGAFEFRQDRIITNLLGTGTNTYNARISVRVIDGQGKITAYGSVIDQNTQDPTFVPAQ